MTPTPSGTADPNLQSLVDKARDDLSHQLAIAPDQINLVEVTEVEWSDSSLDCPQPGMSYLQVITPGYKILLQANEQMYEYHASQSGYFVFCETPAPPVVPKP